MRIFVWACTFWRTVLTSAAVLVATYTHHFSCVRETNASPVQAQCLLLLWGADQFSRGRAGNMPTHVDSFSILWNMTIGWRVMASGVIRQ